jgi:hypothetical protein
MAALDPLTLPIESDELNGILADLVNHDQDSFVPAENIATTSMGANSGQLNNQLLATGQTETTKAAAPMGEHLKRGSRRRNSGTSAKVKELSEQLHQVQLRLSSALTDNIYLRARKEIMEQVCTM